MKNLRILKLLLVLSIVFLMSVSTGFASSHVVTNLDGGTEVPGSLRNILLYVVPGDLVTFPDGFSGTINLTGQIFLTQDITIQGPWEGLITVSGSFIEPASLIQVGYGVNAQISGLTFANANAGIQDGAAISNAGNLRLTECSFLGNQAARGGAVYNGTGLIDPVASMDIFDCQFWGNQSDSGGAIYNEGDLSVESCDFTGNQALTSDGGAISNHGSASLTWCNLTGNTMTSTFMSGGGAISNYDALVLDSCVLENNQALNNRNGGAIYSYNAEGGTFLNNCTLKGNSAGSGGAIRNQDAENYHSEGISLSLTNCILENNVAQYGGGIYSNPQYNKTILTNCIIAGNTATVSAGGISNGNNQLEMRKCTVSGNIAGSSGGGIYNSIYSDNSALRLWNSTITGNIVSTDQGDGGGGACNVQGTFQTTNCTITGNSSPKGGGLSFLNGYVVLKNTIVAFNEGTVSRDIYVDPSGSAECAINNVVNNLVGVDPDPASWFGRSQTNIVLSGDIASTDVFSGIEEGPEVGAPGNTEKMQVLALKAGSIAIDAAHWFDLFGKLVSEDQRGVSRPQGDYNDIGAFERELATYTITATSSAGGTISPVSADVPEGMDQSFTITPYDGFVIEELYADRQRVDFIAQGDTYIFNNVSSNHELEASFMVDPAMMEDAGIEDFGITGTDKGPLADPVAITKQDLLSISVEKVDLAELGAGIPEGNFVTGLSLEMEFDSPDMGNAVTQVDLVLEISRDLLGTDTCAAIDAGDDLEEAFFENVSLYKIVSPDVYDLFEVASEDQDPYDFFEVSSDDSGYYVSMILVIADETAPEGEECVQALLEGQDRFFFVYDGTKDGCFTDPIVAAIKTADEITESGTGGGGSCNVGTLPSAFGLLMVPLLFLLRR